MIDGEEENDLYVIVQDMTLRNTYKQLTKQPIYHNRLFAQFQH